MSKSTIQYTCKKEAERVNSTSKTRHGRPRVIQPAAAEALKQAIQDKPEVTYQELRQTHTPHASLRIVRRFFQEQRLRKWQKLKRPELTVITAEKRLRWAQTYQHYTLDDWKHVRWSDECSIERGKGARREWVFCNPQDRIVRRYVQPERCGKSVKQMFWAAFGHGIRTDLVMMNGDQDTAQGGITARVYKEVLEEYLPTILNPDDVFMHDNAPIHTAHIIRNFLDDLGIRIMNWPSHSPDLNPIENLWSILKQKIYVLYPELLEASDTVKTKSRLIEAAIETWNLLGDEILDKLADGIPKRMAAVLSVQGWYTKY